MTYRTLTAAVLSLGLAAPAGAPALADGAASTRNILLGGAAAAAGTLLIINHNKQVHQKYADDARRQADAESQAQHAQAAYAAEKRAYENEVALNGEFKREVATQHSMIESLRKQVALEQSRSRATASHPPPAPHIVPAASGARPAAAGIAKAAPSHGQPVKVAAASWGWGQL